MKHSPALLAALLGAVVSVPAQTARYVAQRSVTARAASCQAHGQAQSATGRSSVRRASAQRPASVRLGATRGGSRDVLRVQRARVPVGFGRWVTRFEEVLLPGHWDLRYVPAVYGWVRDGCGGRRWGVVAPAGHRHVWVPARYESQRCRVWARY